MNANATSATNDSMNVDAYYESLIMDAVAQADAPLHEALVRSNVYRSINDSYERALANNPSVVSEIRKNYAYAYLIRHFRPFLFSNILLRN